MAEMPDGLWFVLSDTEFAEWSMGRWNISRPMSREGAEAMARDICERCPDSPAKLAFIAFDSVEDFDG